MLKRLIFLIHFQVDTVIAGIIDQRTGDIFSVFQSVYKGLIDYDTGIRLLESQLILTGLISPASGESFDLEEAKTHALVDEQAILQLQDVQTAKEIISESQSTTLPVVAALDQGLITEPLAIKIVEIQLSQGHLKVPATGEQLTLHKAFQRNLIPPALYTKLLERHDIGKDLIDPNTAEKISLERLLERTVVHKGTGLRLLPVIPQEKGRIMLKCGRKMNILRAAHEGLIEKETMFRLLGSQLLSGGIIHPDAGYRMTVENAMREGVIDQDIACAILTHQVQTGGILRTNSSERLTIDEAVQCDLISSSSALLVLQAQQSFSGLIWPHSGEIFPVSTSLHQGMITRELACKILNGRQKIAALYIPETGEVISLDHAAQQGVINSNIALVLNSISLPDKLPNVDDIPLPLKKAARWLSCFQLNPSIQQDPGKDVDAYDTSEPTAHCSEQTQKLFVSYLMINSCMDANTGQRLLLHCGDLKEAVGLLMDGNNSDYGADETEGWFHDSYKNAKGANLMQQLEKAVPSCSTSNAASQQGNVQDISSDSTRVENCKEQKNEKNSGENGFPIGGDGSEHSECARNTLFGKQEGELGKAESATCSPKNKPANVTEQANDGTEGCLSRQGSLPLTTTDDNICIIEVRETNNNYLGILDYFLDVNDSSLIPSEGKVQENIDVSHSIVNSMQKCMPHVLQTTEEGIFMKDGKVKDYFQGSLCTSMEPGGKPLSECIELGICNEIGMLHSGTNNSSLLHDRNRESSLQDFADQNCKLPLEDHSIMHDTLQKDVLHMNDGTPPQENLMYDNLLLKDSANQCSEYLLEEHIRMQDASLKITKEAQEHSPVKDSIVMSVLENHTLTSSDPQLGYKASQTGESLQEHQSEAESWSSPEVSTAVCDCCLQQAIDQTNLHSVSLHDHHSSSNGVPMLECHTENKYIGPFQPDYTVTYSGLPLEENIDTRPRFPVEIRIESLGGSSIMVNSDSQPRSPLKHSTGMIFDLPVTQNEPSVDDKSATCASDRLVLEDNQNKPSEPKQSILHSEHENYKDRKIPCLKDHEGGSEVSPAIQIDCEKADVHYMTRIDEGDSSPVKADAKEEYDNSAIDIKGTAEKLIDLPDATSFDVGLNDKGESMVCFSELSDTDTFEIINLAAFNERILGTISEAAAEGIRDVGEEVQGKESEDMDICPPLKLNKAEVQRERHENVRKKGNCGFEESEHESVHEDSDSDDNVEGDDIEDDFDIYDYVEFDYDTPDDTDYEDEGVLEMHYVQCHDKNTRLQAPALPETTESKAIHCTDHLQSKSDLLCFENHSVNEYQSCVQNLMCKNQNERQQETEQASGSFMENKMVLHNYQTSWLGITNGVASGYVSKVEDIQAELDIPSPSNLYNDYSKAKISDNIPMAFPGCEKRQEVDAGKLVQAVTNIPHSQLEMETLKYGINGQCSQKEDHAQESRESCGETHLAVVKNGSEILFSSDEKSLDQSSNATTSVTHSADESMNYAEEFELSTYLKQCATDLMAQDIVALRWREDVSCYVKEVERGQKGMQKRKELVGTDSSNSKGTKLGELNSKVQPTSASAKPEPGKEGEAAVYSKVHHGKTNSFKSAFNNIEHVEAVEGNKPDTDCDESIHEAGISSSTLDDQVDRWRSAEQKMHETEVSHSGGQSTKENDSKKGGHESAFSEGSIGGKKQLFQKDTTLPHFSAVEKRVCSSDVPVVLPEGLSNVLKGKLKKGRVCCMQEGEPLSYIGTRALVQNLLKMVNSTQGGYEDSSHPDSRQACNDAGSSSLATALGIGESQHSTAPLVWLDNRSPDLLRDILKQDHCSQTTDVIHGTMNKKGQLESGQEKKTAALPLLVASHVDQIFPIPNGAGIFSGFKEEATVASTSACNKALKGDHPVEESDHPSIRSAGSIFEMKETMLGTDEMNMVSHNCCNYFFLVNASKTVLESTL